MKFDIALKRGIWITGKVTDVVTGKPVAAAVDYFPMLTNGHAKDYPNFDPNITMSIGIKTRYKTDKEGRFRIVGLPGEEWSRSTPTTVLSRGRRGRVDQGPDGTGPVANV